MEYAFERSYYLCFASSGTKTCHVCYYTNYYVVFVIQTTLKDCSDNEEEEEEKEEEKLCEYEKQRLKRIKENQAFLASLNLTAAKEEMKALTNKQVKVGLVEGCLQHQLTP